MLTLKNSTPSFARAESGGKGYNLYLMSRLGMPVPDWVVLGRGIHTQFINDTGIGGEIEELLSNFQNNQSTAANTSRAIEKIILTTDIPTAIEKWIKAAYKVIDSETTAIISVRSSAADEDSAAHSFAGQLSSYLYVSGLEDASKYVRLCWVSCFSERALAYRKENGISLKAPGVAVVLQRMVDPETSGVLFTCDPMTEDTEKYVVSAVYGAGEGLVSGALDADTYWIDADSGEIATQEIACKKHAFRSGPSGECKKVAVAKNMRETPCITSKEIQTLHKLGKKLVEFYGRPQDIEWASDGSQIYLLQTRPVTTIKNNLTGFPNLWDNSNIAESYGGLTSPLSFTFALHNYKNVYVQFCEILRIPTSIIKDMEPYLGNMLGCINGRVYYNLYNWYKLVGVLPGFKENRQFMETMMGVGQALSPEIEERIKPHPSWNTPKGRFRKFMTGLAFLGYHFRIQRVVDDFLKKFDSDYQDFRNRDYERMSSDRILAAYEEMDRRMLKHWKAPIINDFLCMVHFGILKRLTCKWLSAPNENIQNDLLSGEGNLESAEPTKTLIRLTAEVAENDELKDLIENTPAPQLFEALNQSEFQDFYSKIHDYIDRFGFRCMNEMKLEETDLVEDPTFLFVCLKNYLRAKNINLSINEEREKGLREVAETCVKEELRGWRRMVYFWVLKHARKAIRNRENTRFARTRIYGVARSMFRAMGEDLAAMGVLTSPKNIFFLTLDEIYGIHQGTLTNLNLKDTVIARKRAYAEFEQLEPKNRFQTRGPVYWRNNFLAEPEKTEIPEDADYDLKGLPCCPGVVENVIKTIDSPKDDLNLNGEILVTMRTDPGWAPLYPGLSGLLIERGSLLSHSAIVAREMGLPTIVRIAGLTDTLKDGQRVRMDGASGTITILD